MKITRAKPPGSSSHVEARALALAGIVVLAALPALPCAAQERDAAPPVVGSDEALELFRRHSLELRAARSDFRATAGRASQEAAYPNPSFSLLREDLSRGGEGYDENSFTLQQTVEWPGRTLARSRAADRTRARARSAFRSDSLRLLLEVRRAYLEAAGAERRATVLQEVADVIREAVKDAEVRRADGDISGYELRRLKLELARLEQRLAAGRIERDAARRELAARILPDSDTVAVATRGLPEGRPPEVGRDAAVAAALRRPAVAAGRHAVEAAAAETSAVRLGRIPDLRLTGGYKTQADDFDGAVLGVSLSLPVFDRKGGALQAAEARESAATSRLGLRRRQARNEVVRALDRYRSVRRRSRVVGTELLAPTGDLLEIARTSYAAGEMELVELLDGADAHLESRLMALELRADLWLAYHELTWAMGGHAAGAGVEEGYEGSDLEGDGR